MSAVLDLRPPAGANAPETIARLPDPVRPAHRLASDAEAVQVARGLARRLAQGAATRHRERRLPVEEIGAFSQSGLRGIRVPRRFGGAAVPYVTGTEVINLISAADPSLGQITQSHLAVVEHVARDAPEILQRDLFEAVLEKARWLVDGALAAPSEETVADASLAVAEAKVLTTEIAILATNKPVELAGTRSTLAEHGLYRHWHNARTHTRHDPARWKFFHVGNYHLNGVKPARHLWL